MSSPYIEELRFLQKQEDLILEQLSLVHRRRDTLFQLMSNRLSDTQEDIHEGHEDEITEHERQVRFNDEDLTIRWSGGRMKFRKDGDRQYRFIKLVWEAGEEGIEHAEIAEQLFDDPMAGLKDLAKWVRSKLSDSGFFYELQNDGKIFWFS